MGKWQKLVRRAIWREKWKVNQMRFDDIDLQLQTVDLEEMGAKYETCTHCGTTIPKDSFCLTCVETFYFVHDSITMCIKLYNERWNGAPICKLPN